MKSNFPASVWNGLSVNHDRQSLQVHTLPNWQDYQQLILETIAVESTLYNMINNPVTGPQGIQGATGNTGPQGPQGDTGIQGAKGDTGPKGDTGAQGVPGSTGNTGSTGSTGTQGIQGTTGTKGDTGPVGPQGATGAQGAVGPTGIQGAQGNTGTTGATGSQGSTGATGTSASLFTNSQFVYNATSISYTATAPLTLTTPKASIPVGTKAAFIIVELFVSSGNLLAVQNLQARINYGDTASTVSSWYNLWSTVSLSLKDGRRITFTDYMNATSLTFGTGAQLSIQIQDTVTGQTYTILDRRLTVFM